MEPAASYQRLDFVRAAVAFGPSQNWGPSAGVKCKHCIRISQQDVGAQRCSAFITFLHFLLGHTLGLALLDVTPAQLNKVVIS